MAVAATVGLARLAVAQVPPPGPPVATEPIDLSKRVQLQIQQEIATLTSGRTQNERDDAARRLVSRQTAESRAEIVRGLSVRPIPPSPAPSTALAAARAAAEELISVPQYVRPLSTLLGVDRVHSEAAAAALVAVRDDAAHTALIAFVGNGNLDVGIRLSAIRVMGTSADKRIAEALVALVTDPRAHPIIARGAGDALAQMTLLPENGRDPTAWNRWWQANRNEPAEEFRANLLDRRRRRPANEGLNDVEAFERLIQLTEEKARPEAVRRILESSDARLRLVGAKLVFRILIATGRVPEGSTARLRDMLRDPAPDVRLEVARTLQALNDQPALEPLLTQLTVEPDAAVRVAIMGALVTVNDPRAAGALLGLLKDPSLRVQVVAAESIAKLGPVIRKDPVLTAQVSAALLQAINGRVQPQQDPAGELKSACLEALVPLRDPRQQQLFIGFLNLNQPVRTRRAALAGLEAIGDPKTGNIVINWLRGEPDAEVRLAALGALRTVGTFELDEVIFDYTRPQVEPDAGNRKAAWDAFVTLSQGGSKERLATWSDRFFRDGQFDRRIPILQEILKKQLAGNEAQAAAITREQIGESYMKLQPPQPLAAIPYYRDALQYWQANGGDQQVILGLTKSSLEAMIGARQYPEAVTFAGAAIAADERTMTSDVMATLTMNAERLIQARQPRDAERLAQEALKLKNIPQRFQDRLQKTIRDAKEAPGI